MIGIIYSIIDNESKDIYYGSTLMSINRRMNSHRYNCKGYDEGKRKSGCSSFNIIRKNDYKVSILETVEFEDKKELLFKEREYIENNNCVNKMKKPISTKQEKLETAKQYQNNKEGRKDYMKTYSIKYREQNKEKLAVQKKEYGEANKEAIKEKSKAYRLKNTEAIKEKKKLEYEKDKLNGKCNIITCECGGTYQFRAKTRHFKTKKHLDFVQNN